MRLIGPTIHVNDALSSFSPSSSTFSLRKYEHDNED